MKYFVTFHTKIYFLLVVGILACAAPPVIEKKNTGPSLAPIPAVNKTKKLDSTGLHAADSIKKPEELKASNPKAKKEALTSSDLSNEDPSKLEKQIKATQRIY